MFDFLSTLTSYGDWWMLIARILFGVVFFYYGWPKLKDLKKNAKDFEGMGFKPGMLWGTIVALLETVGAIGIVLGIWFELFAVLFAVHMIIGTIWKVTKTDKPFTDWSYDLLLLALALVFLAVGTGGLLSFGNFGLY